MANSVFRALPLRAASAFGGWAARVIGPRLSRHHIARENIELALPELGPGEVDRVLAEMWDNFGRTMAEIAHLGTYSRDVDDDGGLITFAGLEHLEALKHDYRGAVFVTGHIGNWEVSGLILRRAGFETVVVYRPPDTPYVDRLLRKQRVKINPNLAIKKRDVKALVSALRARRSISMLVDQRLWQGELLPFFGHDAYTTTMPAKLALRYKVPIVPVRVERVENVRFRVTAYPPIMPPQDAEGADAEIALTLAINRVLEGWIRERPDQWQWQHRRWYIRLRDRQARNTEESENRYDVAGKSRDRRMKAEAKWRGKQGRGPNTKA